jgi:RimJ/RimL family protein N-acetyltransferase
VYAGPAPPYRVETERLVIRCWDPADADPLDEAVDESLAELRPWMQWAVEPFEEPTVEVLRRFRGGFDLGHDFTYGVFSHTGEVLGGTGLHTRIASGLEIGYWIRTSRCGAGLATETAAALTRVGIERCNVERIAIQVEPQNHPSLRVARKLGYREVGLLPRELAPLRRGGPRRDAILFTLLASDLAASPCAAVAYEAFDVTGRQIV